MINLVVACGGGIFTTSIVTEKIEEILRKNKIQGKITPHKITEIPSIRDEDLIVVTGKTNAKNDDGIPVMLGISLFTGVGEEEFTEKFIAKVKEIEANKA